MLVVTAPLAVQRGQEGVGGIRKLLEGAPEAQQPVSRPGSGPDPNRHRTGHEFLTPESSFGS